MSDVENSYPYHQPKQGGTDPNELGAIPLMTLSFLLAALGIASGAVLLWAAHYWMTNTPVFGRPLVPPAFSPGAISAVIFGSIIVTGVFLFFSIATARESIRRWRR
jgi:formate/nitrite transporter FocA (FNT family)